MGFPVSFRLTPVSVAVASVLVATLSVACSALLDANVVQCSLDSDCAGRGFADTKCVNRVCVGGLDAAPPTDAAADAADAAPADPKWGCLGSIKWGAMDISSKVLLHNRYVRFLGEAPVVQMDVTACGRLDPTCSVPLGTGKTDDDGYLNMLVPKYFEGFLTLAPPATFPSMVPSLLTVIPPPEKDADRDASIPTNLAAHLTSTAEVNALLAQIGSSLDPALASVLGIVLDCQGNPVPGVSLRIDVRDKKTVGYYTDDTGTPSVTAQETAARGEAGFVNTPSGPVTIEATVTALNRKMGRYTLLTRPGNITFLTVVPGPSQ
ncbi:hypothetical protein BH11MYX4_BH11MYX4_60870 [soil metagenome]